MQDAKDGLCIALEPWWAVRTGAANAFHVVCRAGSHFTMYRNIVRGHSNVWLA